MSISDNYIPTKQIGNGATVAFTGTWKMLVASYARVYLENVSTGVQVLQANPADYTLALDDDGFTVTFSTPPPATEYVVVAREIDKDQTNPYKTSKGYQGIVLEDSLDKLTAIDQDQQNQIDRSAKSQVGSVAVNLPAYSAGRVLGWSPTTDGDISISLNTLNEMEGAITAVAALTAASGVKVSSNDATVGFLNGKLVAGTNVSFTENNDGSSETLTLDIPDSSLTAKGVVESATTAEMTAGTADKFPDAAKIKVAIDAIKATGTVAASGEIELVEIGLQIKWGTYGGAISSPTITFGTAFPNNIFVVMATCLLINRDTSITSKSVASFVASTYISSAGSASAESFDWLAIGN